MIEVLIKSFNRAYYLDRCIGSLQRYLTGDFSVTILDDGTPKRYLDRIQSLYPDVAIKYSRSYFQKSSGIVEFNERGTPYLLRSIPVELWIRAAREATPVFLLLEDDCWLTEDTHLDEILDVMQRSAMATLTMSWGGCPRLVMGKKLSLSPNLEEIMPSIGPMIPLLLENRFKIRSILDRLGLFQHRMYQPVYAMYAITNAFFEKNYWLFLWESARDVVDEPEQLRKAVRWRKRHPSVRYGKTKIQHAATSFLTSATNNYPDVNIDILQVNYHFNEAWLDGRLKSSSNLPRDFELSELVGLLDQVGDPHCPSAEFSRWTERFKAQYRAVGFDVDS